MPSDRATAGRKKDATSAFFSDLAERGHEPLLATTTGTLRFDLVSGKRLDRALFDRMVTGKANAMAATLRGVIVPEGDLGLVISFQRLFPGPPASRRSPARAAAKAGGKR